MIYNNHQSTIAFNIIMIAYRNIILTLSPKNNLSDGVCLSGPTIVLLCISLNWIIRCQMVLLSGIPRLYSSLLIYLSQPFPLSQSSQKTVLAVSKQLILTASVPTC